MKILHVCLASHYTEGMTYQDNLLPLQNALDGHDVMVVSDCYQYVDGQLVSVLEEDRILSSGIRLKRMRYTNFLNEFLSSKIRKVNGLYDVVRSYSPDVILFHGVAGWEMLTVFEYKKHYPKVKLYIDSHEDFHNSGKNWVSRLFQYKIFNRLLVAIIKREVDKFLYLSYESRDFLVRMYGLVDAELEFYPLGGQVLSESQSSTFAMEVRDKHGLSADDVIIVHSGKLDQGKRTEETLRAFSAVCSPNLKLVIIGSIPADQSARLQPLIDADQRIIFVGWQPAVELIKYLAAADLYFQPGTQSATMQNAICAGSPVALYPYASHKPYLVENGFWVESYSDFIDVFKFIAASPESLKEMRRQSFRLAQSLLDYKILAARLYV